MIFFLKNIRLRGLSARVVTALFGLPLIYITLRLGNPLLGLVVVAVGSIAAFEAYTVLKNIGHRLTPWFFVLCAAIIVFSGMNSLSSVILCILIALGLIILESSFKNNNFVPSRSTLQSALLLAYVSVPLALFTLLSNGLYGFDWAFIALASVFMTDSCAYFFGRIFGRHQMAPSISPSKTWEGALGGTFAGIATALILIFTTAIPWDLMAASLLAVLIVVFAQIGDIFVSKLKRMANLKDSGRIIFGHGGVLDRLDSLLPVFVLIYCAAINWPE